MARDEDIFAIFFLLLNPILKLDIGKLIYFTWIFANFMHFFHRLRQKYLICKKKDENKRGKSSTKLLAIFFSFVHLLW